jgi:hypothetical protein
MSHWNYRILAVEYPDDIYFEMGEVYYDKDGVPDGYCMNKGVGSETTKGIGWTLNRMKEALKKPILCSGERFPQEYETNNKQK